MNKKTIIGVLVAAIIIFGFLFLTGEREAPIDEPAEIDMEEAKVIAEEWITNNAPTYLFDGSDLEFLDGEELIEGSLYELDFSFVSSAAGYGDRSDEMVAQVITPHTIEVTVWDKEVTGAITDGTYDEMRDAMIEEKEELPEARSINLYFVEVVDGQEEIVEVEREVPYTETIGRESIMQLLAGPTAEEEAEGFSTSIPEETELIDLHIEEGVATADFTAELQEGVAGSAWVTTIRGQIEKTLMQFETVDEVVIMVEGESEEVLQP